MAEIILARHGQANSEGTDEASYDRLSALGRQQSRWLGDWLRATGEPIDRTIRGALRRHRQTAEGIALHGDAAEDARWNELDYFGLSDQLFETHGLKPPQTPGGFADHIAMFMSAWAAGAIPNPVETYEEFRERVMAALNAAREGGGRTLVVTSGGVISMAVATTLGLGPDGLARLSMRTANSSLHRLVWERGSWRLAEFGATPHLARPDRAHALTFV